MIDQGVTDTLASRDADRNTNGDDSYNSRMGVRRNERATRECTYPDFMKCQPLNFKGTEGVVELTQWIEKMETVTVVNKRCICNDLCDRTEKEETTSTARGTRIKLEVELGILKVKESDKIERYVSGLPDMIHGSVVASKPKTMQEATEIATELMYNRIRALLESSDRETKESKMITNNNNNNKTRGRTLAGRTLQGLCNRVGHLTHDCRSPANTNASNNQRGTRTGQKPTCYECGNQGHYKSDCPELKNQNHVNQAEGTEARGM
ncbi:reverse transcriptase domain-containing protein [Tanacetum coccineum]